VRKDVPLWRLILPEPDHEAKSVISLLWQQNRAVIPKGWHCAILAHPCGDIATFRNADMLLVAKQIASCDMTIA
jgi:hypothetical protein